MLEQESVGILRWGSDTKIKFDLQFKVIRQGHVIYFTIFGFFDLYYVENDTNFITLSHLHQKLSRLTNNVLMPVLKFLHILL